MVAEKERLPRLTLERLLARFETLQNADNYRLSALLPDAVLSTHRLTAIPDIFDRLVVADALQNRMPLLTRDSSIQAAQVVETIWD